MSNVPPPPPPSSPGPDMPPPPSFLPQPGHGTYSFTEAVKVCFQKYATFRGRARRSEYWYFILFNFVVSIAAGILDGIVNVNVVGSVGANTGANLGPGFHSGPFSSLASIALLLPTMAAAVRRLHDVGKSAFWAFATAVTGIPGAIALIFGTYIATGGFEPGIGATSYSQGTGFVLMSIGGVLMLITLGLGIRAFVLLLDPGYDSPNAYGTRD